MAGLFEKIDKIKPLFDVIYKIVMFICKVLLVADILITSMAVAGRFIPFIPDPAWSEEVVLTLMAYMAVLSASLAIRTNTHIRMTVFDTYLPKKVIQILDIAADIMVLALAIVMIVVGMQYASKIGSRSTYVSMPTLSQFWKYFPIPLAGMAMLFFGIETFYGHIKELCGYGEEEK